MLKVAYIASSEPVIKPKRLTAKQLIAQNAEEYLTLLTHQNHAKALIKYSDRIKALEKRTAYLKSLENGHR